MNRRNFLSLGVVVPSVAALAACNKETLIQHAEAAVDRLLPQLKATLEPNRPLIVASFVNVDDLEASSTFGRTMAELVSSVLAQRGIAVADVRLRNALAARPTGELTLSREAAALAKVHNAQAVLAGTYAVLTPNVVASLKVIRIGDNRVLAATDAELRHEV